MPLSSRECLQEFDRDWKKQLAGPKPSLWGAASAGIMPTILCTGFLHLIVVISQFASPLVRASSFLRAALRPPPPTLRCAANRPTARTPGRRTDATRVANGLKLRTETPFVSPRPSRCCRPSWAASRAERTRRTPPRTGKGSAPPITPSTASRAYWYCLSSIFSHHTPLPVRFSRDRSFSACLQ